MNIIYVRIIILFIALFYCAYTDYKKYAVYNYITYLLIVIGLLLNLFTYSLSIFLFILFIITSLFLLFGVFYKQIEKYISGGDLKLGLGIFAIVPFYSGITNYFVVDVFIWAFVFSGITSLVCLKSREGKYLPFAIFILLGAIASFVFGIFLNSIML